MSDEPELVRPSDIPGLALIFNHKGFNLMAESYVDLIDSHIDYNEWAVIFGKYSFDSNVGSSFLAVILCQE